MMKLFRTFNALAFILFYSTCTVKSDPYNSKCVDIPKESIHWNKLERLSSNSKYLFAKDKGYVSDTHPKVVSFCKASGLELAKITSVDDYKAIVTYRRALEKTSTNYPQLMWISGMDEDEEGNWKYHDYKPMTFAAFYAFDPVDDSFEGTKSADYVGLMWSKNDTLGTSSTYAMIDSEEAESKVQSKGVCCQWKKDTSCFKKSDEEKRNKEAPDGLKKLGKSGSRQYFIADKQKNHADGKSFCESQKKKLLDFNFKSSDESKDLYRLLSDWTKTQDLPGTATSFVLSGKDVTLFQGDQTTVEWEWVDNKLRDQTADLYQYIKYKKIGKRKFGRCLSVGTLFFGSTVFSLSRALCKLPRWVVCYEDWDGKPPTTEKPSTTTDPWTTPTTTDPWTDPTTTDPWTDPTTTDPWTDPTTTDPWTDPPTTWTPRPSTESPPDNEDPYRENEAWTWGLIAV